MGTMDPMIFKIVFYFPCSFSKILYIVDKILFPLGIRYGKVLPYIFAFIINYFKVYFIYMTDVNITDSLCDHRFKLNHDLDRFFFYYSKLNKIIVFKCKSSWLFFQRKCEKYNGCIIDVTEDVANIGCLIKTVDVRLIKGYLLYCFLS